MDVKVVEVEVEVEENDEVDGNGCQLTLESGSGDYPNSEKGKKSKCVKQEWERE